MLKRVKTLQTSNDGRGICAHLHFKCSTLSVCATNNRTCFAPGHVCVKHSQCQNCPLCYPVYMAGQHHFIFQYLDAPLVPNDGICATATWNPNADGENDRIIKWSVGATEVVIVAGGNGRGNDTNQCNELTAIVMDHMGTMYVTDYHNHRVTRWFNGSKMGVIIIGERGEGEEPDQLRFPTDLAFDRNGNLWVVDYINNRIQMFAIDKNSC
ncbi:unnamed protein product [Rotaria magnacalcarata]|uniref:Uncharacterized protein n=1 Tax=Rotaria magnacalcarata TaxID=392030 RepID=A0A8S2KHQ4_9BILA|nr:unnamed protein product [Rotaria magnacalcarata]CAF3878550.1 unnamed protein product [Rotaria magnacalcarata]